MKRNTATSPDPSDKYTPQEIEQGRLMSILAYIGVLIIIPILIGNDSKYIRFHINQGLVLCVTWIGWAIIDSVLSAILNNILSSALELWNLYSMCVTVLNLVYLIFIALAVIGIINVVNGRARELPIIGKYRILT